MTFERISIEEAQSMVDDLKAKNVRNADIRRKMVDEGFSYAEIDNMLGEEHTPMSSNLPANSAKFYTKPPLMNQKSGWQKIRHVDKVLQASIAIILGIVLFFMGFSGNENFPAWLILAGPGLSAIAGLRLWLLMKN